MGEVERTVRLGAEPERVWTFVTDPKRFGEYVEGWGGGVVSTANATGVGAGYEWTARLGPLSLSCTETIVAWDPPRRVDYEGQLFGVTFHSSMEVASAAPGKAELAVCIRTHVPMSRGGAVTDALLRPLVGHYVKRSVNKLAAAF